MRHNFKSLKVWQKAMDLTDMTFDFCKELPANERYNLIDQINRCSCSVPSNIAEGWVKTLISILQNFYLYQYLHLLNSRHNC